MTKRTHISWRTKIPAIAATIILAFALAAIPFRKASALIEGGEGNKPINDPGWPAGAAAIFNHVGRIAYWEGPPFGGGEWHAECRGDATAINAVLVDFAKLDIKTKRLLIHDGPGSSFWLNANREKDKVPASKMDWSFSVWQPESWERLRKMPADFSAHSGADAAGGPPAQIDIYTSDTLKWTDLVIPDGVKLDDQRMAAHGFTPADGNVIEGKVIDLATKKPIAARVRLEKIESQEKGGYKYTLAAKVPVDAQGHWVLKNAPTGWHRIIIEADGYVPRVAGHAQFDEPARWHSYDSGLLPPAPVSGRVTDDDGKPMADVNVQFGNVASATGEGYGAPDEFATKTDADGRFHANLIPGGATVWIRKEGYCRPGLGPNIKVPASDLALTMKKSTRLVVTVDFKGAPANKGYMIDLEPEGGNKVGSWGGSATINEKNQYAFENVPPGKYSLVGHPNPSGANDRTDPVAVELKGGEIKEVSLTAKPPPVQAPAAVKPPTAPKTTNDRF